ncbi:calcium/proton exchanger [Exophiala spinifera]|uniref:Calcium/proton exchanger n=1 Tax=Exophiala spinifera TaxID=91928 RepID=A0A0D2BR32_9EURO|nr:calcium/proton exchanger [Exophiala spinifera]KIW13674.1 calcium/proton exchanger [Exophiala spinifera]
MHKYRREAKYAAWYDDPNDTSNFKIKNPFSKWRPDTRQNSMRTMEDGEARDRRRGQQLVQDSEVTDGDKGNGSPLKSTLTDDPNDYRLGTPVDRKGQHHRHAETEPGATSAAKPYPPGDEIRIPRSMSPDLSEKEIRAHDDPQRAESSSDTYINGNAADSGNSNPLRNRTTNSKTEPHGIRRFFTKESSADSDDDNGKNKKKFTAWSQIHATLFNSWINILLIASPVGIAVYYAHIDPVAVFVINFIAIIPLAAMLSYATEEIALRVGEVMGGLLNASFGNAVELIVSIIALAKDQVLIVQTSLIGSMLSNLLLVMGMCFFFGGFNRMEQAFNLTVAQTASSLLFLAVSSLIIPTAFEEWARTSDGSTSNEDATTDKPKPGVAAVSRGTAILLLIVYGCYLFFQLKSHTAIYNTPGEKNRKRSVGKKFKNAVLPERLRKRTLEERNAVVVEEESEEPEEPNLSVWVAIATLAASTVLVALNAEYLVDSINDITCGGGVNKNFVGLILLPIVGNAAEHATAVTVAVKDKMDLAIGVAVGSSLQIALLVLPFVVVLGWIIGKDDMTLFFDGFQIAVLFVAVLLVNYLIADGKSHWLEGVLLMILYVIIAVAAWFYPSAKGLNNCPADT